MKDTRNSGLMISLKIIALYVAAGLLLAFSSASAVEVSTPIKNASEIEMSCRLKAKEIAAETYRGCVADQKNAQIDQIKKEYADRLAALKAHYEEELKKLGSGKKMSPADESAITAEALAAKNGKSSKPEFSKKNQTAKVSGKVKATKAPAAKPVVTKAESEVVTEMSVQLKPAPAEPMTDESVLDLPEPTGSSPVVE